jgi:pimeloyl-ACP methyl ester carboxylesterase
VSPSRKKSPEPEIRHRRAPASDGVAIAYTLWRRPARELLILAPGFWRVRLNRENLFLGEHFLRRGYDVAALDFRGHGDSGGGYAFGASDKLYARFSVLGLSLGGSIAAQALALRPELPCRALAMVSSPSDVSRLRPKPWKAGALRQVRLRHAVRVPRIAAASLRGRRPRAAEAIASLTMPKLIVTSEGDWLVDPAQGRELAAQAASPVEHVHLDLPGSLHADGLVKFVPVQLLRVLDRWFALHSPP